MLSSKNDNLTTLKTIINFNQISNQIEFHPELLDTILQLLNSPSSIEEPSTDLSLSNHISSLILAILPPAYSGTSQHQITPENLVSFLADELFSKFDNETQPSRVSELIADSIWVIEQSIEANRSITQETIKNAQSPNPTSTERLSILSSARQLLIDLSKLLISPNSNSQGICILDINHCKLSWEYGFLSELGIIPFTADLIGKQATRLNTGLHYKQQRFNLLREESEGYSHLATELLSSMGPGTTADLVQSTSQGEPTSYPNLRSILISGESEKLLSARIEKVINNVKALIGFFDLDPNRTLDIILDVFCYSVTTHHSFFCGLLKKTHWFKKSNLQTSTDDDQTTASVGNSFQGVKECENTNSGSKLISSLLGFKFVHYQNPDQTESTPEELYLMTAILIWQKIISLSDILPHLTPDPEGIKKMESDWKDDVYNQAAGSGPKNALSMAGALDGSSSLVLSSNSKLPPNKSSIETSKHREALNQKTGLLNALLSIGALQESIFLLSLPNHQFLAFRNPSISGLLLRLIDVAISPAFINGGLSLADPEIKEKLSRPKRKYVGGALHQLVEAEIPKAVLSSKVGPKPSSLIPTVPATSTKTEWVFFWDHWKDRIPGAKNGEEVLDSVWPLMKFVGPYGNMNTSVFHKIAKLTAKAFEGEIESTDIRWQHILRWYLLPSLSMMEGSIAASNYVWGILEKFPYESRYMIYGEWKERIYNRIPELKVQRVKADNETKRVLKTMTSENLKEKSRALGKLASSNPCIVFNAALHQVQTYDNLITCVIETLRYLNIFSLDVLTYSIVEFLSNPDKDRSKSDGYNLASWLQNLAKFVGNVFKRNLILDPTIILQYLSNQLSKGNSKDLIILREMISKMAGIDVLVDLSNSQVIGLGGSMTLRSEAISPTTLTVKKTSMFNKSSNRLMKALKQSGLLVPILVLVALQRQNAVLLADEDAHLKYLGVLADNCQQVLFQYLEFLQSQLDLDQYSKILPSISEMWGKFDLEPSIVFHTWRPILANQVRPTVKIGNDGEVIMVKSDVDVVMENVGEIENGANGIGEQAQYPPSLDPVVAVAENMLSEQTRKLVGSHFFVTFWQLELYDIRMPDERYLAETSRLNNLLTELDREYANPNPLTFNKDLNRATRAKILEIRSTLTKEMKVHIKNYELTRARLVAEKSFWFSQISGRSPLRAQLLEHIIQHCLNPRSKLSPVDAAYTAQFVKTIHSLGTSSFMTLKLFDRIFSPDVGPTIFVCSETEASNYGKFLRDLLGLIKTWFDDEKIFKKTGLGKDKKGNYLPGLRMKLKGGNGDETPVNGNGNGSVANGNGNNGAIPESDMLSHDNLQKVFKKWTGVMSSVCKDAIQCGEYMHIRNSIAVLKELDGLVPLFEDQAVILEGAVTGLLKNEKREDVRVLVYGYQSMLKRAAKFVIKNKTPASSSASSSLATRKLDNKNKAPPTLSNASGPPPAVVPPPVQSTTSTATVSNDQPPPAPNAPSTKIIGNGIGNQPDLRPSQSSTSSRPAGLPERPTSRLAPPPPSSTVSVGRQEADRKSAAQGPPRPPAPNLAPPAPRHPTNAELEKNGRYGSDLTNAKAIAPPARPSAEASEREALARAAVQRSRKFATNPNGPLSQNPNTAIPNPNATSLPGSNLPGTGIVSSSPQLKETWPPADDPRSAQHRHMMASSGNRSNLSSPSIMGGKVLESGPGGARYVPSGPKSLTSRTMSGKIEEMRPPSAPKAEQPQRFQPHSSPVTSMVNSSPRHLRDQSNVKRGGTDDHRIRERSITEGGTEYTRREPREEHHRRTRGEESNGSRTRQGSAESIRSGRDREKRSNGNSSGEKRKRSRSPFPGTSTPTIDLTRGHHRDHRERDRDRDRDRDRSDRGERSTRDRDPDRDRDRDRDRERGDRGERDRDRKDRETRHTTKEKEKDGGETREKDRGVSGNGERRSHRRDKEKEKVEEEGSTKRRKVAETGGNGSAGTTEMMNIPSGPRALQNQSHHSQHQHSHQRLTNNGNTRIGINNGSIPMNRTDQSQEIILIDKGGNMITEPKKNISIRGMAANALQKANEDNARKDHRKDSATSIPSSATIMDGGGTLLARMTDETKNAEDSSHGKRKGGTVTITTEDQENGRRRKGSGVVEKRRDRSRDKSERGERERGERGDKERDRGERSERGDRDRSDRGDKDRDRDRDRSKKSSRH